MTNEYLFTAYTREGRLSLDVTYFIRDESGDLQVSTKAGFKLDGSAVADLINTLQTAKELS
jgi:histidinol phosphatase-like enzyme